MSVDDGSFLRRLQTLFESDPLIDEIGILFTEDESESDVESAFMLEDHKLGVVFAVAPRLFREARNQFYICNGAFKRSGGAGDDDHLQEQTRSQLLLCTRVLLLLNGDFYTAWNTRKAFVAEGWLDAAQEVQFCDLVFTLHPKSIDTWAYRRWLATRLYASLTGEELTAFYHAQIAVCGKLAELKPRNYHAWSFRHWLLSTFAVVNPALLDTELDAMRQWCSSHITDHSGWNHRQHVLNLCIQLNACSADGALLPRKTTQLMLNEHAYLSSILLLYPEHEALWCHRRFIFSVLVRSFSSSGDQWYAETNAIVSEFDPLLVLATERIDSAWTAIREAFEASNVQQSCSWALLRESLVAWQCCNRFARRYTLWCLDRLQKGPGGSSNIATSPAARSVLAQLSQRLRDQLKHEDSVLLNLWSVS